MGLIVKGVNQDSLVLQQQSEKEEIHRIVSRVSVIPQVHI
jgi:hypothetical protein